MSKFFQNKNADQPVTAGKFVFNFAKTHYNEGTRSYWGMYEAKDSAEQKALESLVSSGKVFALTEQEAMILLEKKSVLRSPKSVIDSVRSPELTSGNAQSAELADDEEAAQERDAVDMEAIFSEEKVEAEEEQEEQPKPEVEEPAKPKKRRGRPPKKQSSE